MIGARALCLSVRQQQVKNCCLQDCFHWLPISPFRRTRDRINTICTHRQMSLMVEKSCRDAIRKGREEKAMNRRLTEWQELNVHDEISESAVHSKVVYHRIFWSAQAGLPELHCWIPEQRKRIFWYYSGIRQCSPGRLSNIRQNIRWYGIK